MSDTEALAPRQSTLPTEYTGLGDTTVGAADIELPRLKLLQALSQVVVDGDAPQGVFFNSLTGENYGPMVRVVPVIGFKNRVYMLPGQGLLCRSLDTVTGIGTPGGSCAACTLKDWPEDRTAGGPKCRESRNWVGLVVAAHGDKPLKKGESPELHGLDEPAFIVIQFTSTAAAAARKLNGLFLNYRITNPKAQWRDYVFELASGQQKNEKGTYFVPNVKPAGKTTDEQKAAAQALATFMAGKTLDLTEDDAAEAYADDPAPVTAAPGSTPEF